MAPLEVSTLRDAARPAAIIADRRLYLTADRATVVEEGDPRAAFLLVGQGGEIAATEVERLGLRSDDNARVAIPRVETAHSGPETAARRKGEDKARRKGEDK